MPELSLGIGRAISNSGGLQREVLYWYDERGVRYQTPEEISQQTQQQAAQLTEMLDRYRQRFGELPEEE